MRKSVHESQIGIRPGIDGQAPGSTAVVKGHVMPLARADGSQTGPGAPKGEEEEKRAQGTASRMGRLASAQVGRKRAL